MRHISELEKILSHFLNWNKSRVQCLAQILQALFYVRTVNLTQIAEAFQTTTKQESSYRRIQRFFKEFSFDMSSIVILVLSLFIVDGKFTLIMDRTNWKWGKKNINILMLSVEYFGIGIPLFWTILGTAGNSSTKERIDLLKRVIDKFGSNRIEVLLADREFIGDAWFRFLITENIPFVIRVKKNFMAEGIRVGYEVPIGELLKKVKRTKTLLNHQIILWGHSLYVSISNAKKAKEPMIVVSNISFANSITRYGKRWGIETLFACLKTRGFCMEETHMTEDNKIEKLIFILAIAFCWAYKTGEIQVHQVPIKVKIHGRKAKSIFRVGLSLIRSVLLRISKQFKQFVILLSCLTPSKSRRCII